MSVLPLLVTLSLRPPLMGNSIVDKSHDHGHAGINTFVTMNISILLHVHNFINNLQSCFQVL